MAQKIQPREAALPEKKKEGWWDAIRFLLILFIAAFLLRTFIVAPFNIPSGSMLPTLRIGDYLFVAKWPYGVSRHSFPFGIAGFSGRLAADLPERGDVVVFRYPGVGKGDYVKRVIGLPGDTVAMRGGQIILNGEPVQRTRVADFLMPVSPNSRCRSVTGEMNEVEGEDEELYCAYPRFRETLPDGLSYYVLDQTKNGPGDTLPMVTVPEGHVFVMGDNRDDSLDSRFTLAETGVGLLPVENLLGPAAITFFSTDGSAEWIKPWTWFTAARWSRIGLTFP